MVFAGDPFRLVCNTKSARKPNFASPIIIANKLYTKTFAIIWVVANICAGVLEEEYTASFFSAVLP